MSKYAERTSVPVSRSIDEIGRIVKRYSANHWAVLHSSTQIGVEFALDDFQVRVALPVTTASEQEVRRLWRVLILLLKSRFELIEAGAESPAQAFMAYIRLPSGQTTSDAVLPQIMDQVRPIPLGAGT